MKTIYIFLVVVSFSIISWAQPKRAGVKYPDAEAFGVNEGLSQGLVNDITQDRYGFIWFATMDGLNRYDGYNVTVYRHDAEDSNSISDNYISAVFVDSRNRLWTGTQSGGLHLFNYEKEQFIHFRQSGNPNNSLSDDHILSIQEDAQGALWVGTKKGLNKITISEKDFIYPQKNNKVAYPFPGTQDVTIQHIQLEAKGEELFAAHEITNDLPSFAPDFFIDLKGCIFVMTEKNYYSIKTSLTTADIISKIPPLTPDTKDQEKISAIASVTRTLSDRQSFLFQMASKCVAEIDPRTGIVKLKKHLDSDVIKPRSNTPYINENLWFVHRNVLFQYLETSQRVVEIKSYQPNDQLFIQHSITVFKDFTGKVWVGTSGYGALKFDTNNEKFNRVKSPSVKWFSSNIADKVIIKEEDSTYLLERDPSNPNLKTWQKSNIFFKEVYSNLNGKYLKSSVHDSDGNLWVQSEGIQKYDLKKKQLKHLVRKPIVWSALYVDDEDGIWFCEDTVLCKISSTGEEIIYPSPLRNLTADFYITTIFRDSLYILWVGTSKGLFRFDEKKQKWERFSFRSDDQSSISSNFILTICAHSNNRYLWVGTNGGGFNLFDKETGTCARYKMEDGLSNNVVYGILTDNSGKLWMSTNNGISNFDPVTKSFDNFTVEDGLQGNEFNRYAYCKTKDGTLFFGGVTGYNYFNPKDINNSLPGHRVIITDIKTNGHSLDFHEKNAALSKPVYLTKKLVLSFLSNVISFDFSNMNFKTSTHDKYLYMLEGVDKDWISTSTNHSSVYSNLHPGSYIFKVRTRGSGENATSIEVVILPPWYLTWWFMLFFAMLVTGLMYLFYRYNVNFEISLLKDHQRIASDLHDEIGSTLSSIHIYSEVALSKIKNKPLETETYLRQISTNVENTIGSLDDIVWTLNAKNDRFEDIGNRMRAAAVSICEASGYKLHLHFDDLLNELKFGKETRKNLFLIYKEAINNAMKYANGNNLFIDLTVARKIIILSVKDDGAGFDAKIKINGNGLSNMRKRAKDLNGTLEIISLARKGTTIRLQFDYTKTR